MTLMTIDPDTIFTDDSRVIVTIDSHTEGEATRLVVGGTGPVPGRTMMEKLSFFESRYDHIRCLLTKEPRGSRDILAAVVTENVTPEAAFGLIYMDARRYPYLCGHATMGAVATLARTGALALVPGENRVAVDTPSGVMTVQVTVKDGRVDELAIRMVPSFVLKTGEVVRVDGFGPVTVDIVCTGGFFAMVDAGRLGIPPDIEHKDILVDLGMKIIDAANRQVAVRHPVRPDVNTVDVTEFYDSAVVDGQACGRGVVVYGESHMDRSPCGTGTAAKLALLHHKGEIGLNRPYINSSPLGTAFRAELVEKTRIGGFDAVVTRIRGRVWMTGVHRFVLEDTDPFQQGYLV